MRRMGEALSESRNELLETACHRITQTDRPAYVKNSDLRYVAVNDAYARFFGREISDFIGFRSHELSTSQDAAEREDKERRAIVFGTEETSRCFDADHLSAFEVQIESFMPSADRAYVFGIFAEPPVAMPASRPEISQAHNADLALIRAELELAPYPVGIFAEDGRPLVENALFRQQRAGKEPLPRLEVSGLQSPIAEDILDLIDIGVGVYDADLTLVYCNQRWLQLYRPLVGEAPVGMTARDIYNRMFASLSTHGSEPADRQSWVASRLKTLSDGFNDSIQQLPGGDWLRCVNKRLPDGSVISLRIDVTSMKNQEVLLRQHLDETRLYLTILQDLPVPAFVRGQDHRLIYGNDAYFSMMGLSREDALGKTEEEMYGPAQGALLFAQNDNSLQSDGLSEYEHEILNPGGRQHALVTRIKGVSDSDGQRYLVGSLVDVSTIKQRATQLVEARTQAEKLRQDLETMIGSMPAGILIIDRNLDVEYTNDAFYEIWQLSEVDRREALTLHELMHRNYMRGHYGAEAGDFDALYRARVEALRNPEVDLQFEILFGDDRCVLVDGRRMSDGRVLLSYSDISSLRRQARQLSEGRQALERLGELMKDATHAMSQGLMIVKDGIILLSNEALAGMLRMEPAALAAGNSWLRVLQTCAARGDLGPDPTAVLAEWADKIRQRQPISAAFRIGEDVWLQLDASMSAADRWLVVVTDITEMKTREKELRRLLDRSEAADRAKSEFLANMSHEIRTPMNGVLGMAELLARTGLDARQKAFVDIIVKSGNALLTIINDILDFSKIDAGQMQLRRAPFDPLEAAEDVATLLSSQAREKNLELLVRGSPRLSPMVLGDAGRFRQILTNIVGNAVKFTEHGHVLVEIDAGRSVDGGEMVSVVVSDTGIGISKKRLETIFDKFSQVDSSSTRRHEGTGLGLAITAGLVDLFGGYLEVESVLGSGSAFKVHLPLPATAARREQAAVPVNVKGAQILVIDDNPTNRQILTEQLRMWGFDSVAVADGPAGLAILEAAADMAVSIDAVILDYHMPDMNGAEVAGAMRRDSRFDRVPLIFLTSIDIASKDAAWTRSGDAHLMKPARANVLRNTVIEVVRAARQRLATGEDVHKVQTSPGVKRFEHASAIAMPDEAEAMDRPVDILVAEDNEVNQIVFTQILQTMGVRFMIVGNGEEAVKAYRRYLPALIMMDVSMPVMNGLQATREIRQIEAGGQIDRPVAIIGVTAHALASDHDLCIESGMDDYMSKPVSPELLESKIRLWLDRDDLQSRSGS